MKSKKIKEEKIIKFVSSILNKYSWQVKKGHGSFITFDFGKPQVKVINYLQKVGIPHSSNKLKSRTTYLKGKFHLWIYCCNWEIRAKNQLLAFDESPDNEIEFATNFLKGQKLINVEIDTKRAITIFKFDLMGELITSNKFYEKGYEMWKLNSKEKSLTFRNDGLFSFVKGDLKPKQEIFKKVNSKIIKII